jgi:hypothetical protein
LKIKFDEFSRFSEFKGFSGFNDPDTMDSRLFYDFRKIFRKIFRSKKISADLKESNEVVDEKIVPVPEVIQFIST